MPRCIAIMMLAWGIISTKSGFSSGLPPHDPVTQHVESFLATCDAFLKQGNIAEGEKMIDSAEAIMLHIDHPEHLIQFRYCTQKGRYLSFTGQHDQALSWFHRAILHAVTLKSQYPREIARLYGDLAALFFSLVDYPDAIRYYRLALSIQPNELFTDKIEAIYYKVCLANSFWNNCQSAEASDLILSCKTFLDNIDDPYNPALLDIYFTAAEYYLSNRQNRPETEKYLRNATIILNRHYPTNHFNYGLLYHLKSIHGCSKLDHENALHYCNQSMQIVTSCPSLFRYQIENYALMAGIYCFSDHDYEKVITFCSQVISRLQHTAQSPAFFYYLIGYSYLNMNNRKQAEYFYRKSILTASESNTAIENLTCSHSYFDLSKLYQNQPERAIYYLRKALEVSQRISDKGGKIPVINKELALIYYRTKNYRETLIYLQRSIIAACKTFTDTSVLKNPPLADIQSTFTLIETFNFKAYMLYMQYEENNHDLKYLESAFNCQELAVQITQNTVIDINNENAGLYVGNIRKKSMDNAVSIATLLYLRTGKRVYAEKALAYAEKSKMQVLLINTKKKEKLLHTGVPDSLIHLEETLNYEILGIENQLALIEKGDSPEIKDNPLARLTLLYDLREDLTARLEENFPAYGKSKYNLNVSGIDEIQQMLDSDQVILEYQLLETEIIIFVIKKNDFSIHYQLIDKLVRENITKLRSAIAMDPTQYNPDSVFRAFTNSAHYLYEKLIDPVYDKIKDKRLIIIPHNKLTEIPFDVLISKLPDDFKHPNYRSLPYLIREFPIVYAYSANFLLDQEPNKKFGSGTGVFLPDYTSYTGLNESPAFQLLEGAALEASSIRKITRGRLFSGSKAEEKMFKKKASGYKILHIASHTLVNEKQPNLSCLVMTAPSDSSGDGYLYAYELRQMDLNAQLVVLSGCNTGFGQLRMSEGLVSLARSFFYTGVRTVAFTLWPVADKAGSRLITSFYNGIKHRETLDNAMRNAKLDFLEKADPVKTHPFYWADYIIVGKTDRIPLRKFPRWAEIMLVSLLIAMLSVFLYRKFKV